MDENEYNKIKTLCEFIFVDQYQEKATFPRFEKCFQPLFNNIEKISFITIFKDIVGQKRKYITYKRFLRAYLNYKNDKEILKEDTKIFFDKLINSILKTEKDFIGENIENNLTYSTKTISKSRDSLTNVQVLNDICGKIHGINLEYDGNYKLEFFPKSLENRLQLILDMKLGIIDLELFKVNLKKYKNIKNDLYRDAITHVFGTINENGFVSFIGFKSISGKTQFVGFPEGNGFLFCEFGKKIHDFRVQLNKEGINKLQIGFKNNQRTNYYLQNIKSFTDEELNKDELIKDEENLDKLKNEEEIDKLITTQIIEDNHFFNTDLKDELCGYDYKEVIDQYPRKWLDKNKKIKNILIKTVENAIEKYNEEKMKTITRSTIIMNKNQIYDFKYNCYQNPLLLKKQELKIIPNPFFSGYQINIDNGTIFHKTQIYKKQNSSDKEIKDNYNIINNIKTEILSDRNRKYLKLNNFFNKQNYNNIIGDLAKSIKKEINQHYLDNNNYVQQIFLDKFFSYSDELNSDIQSFNDNKIKVEDEPEEIKDEEKKEEIPDEYQIESIEEGSISSNALIFETNLEKAKGGLKGGFFSNLFKRFFSRKTDDTKIIKKWQNFKNGMKKKNGFYLFQTIGLVIKAIKTVNQKNIPASKKMELYKLLKENEVIFNFLKSKKANPEQLEEENPEILIPEEHPERIKSLTELQKNLEKLKEFKKDKNLPKEKMKKIEALYNLYLKQKNILIENETLNQKAKLLAKNNIDQEVYLKEEKNRRRLAKEEENKKIAKAELKKQLKEKEDSKKLLIESFYSKKLLVEKENVFMKQKLPESLKKWEDDKFIPDKKSLCPYDKNGEWILCEDAENDDVWDWDTLEWSKSEEIGDLTNCKFVEKEPILENVKQGDYLQDCYFISAIGSLCSHGIYYDKLFHTKIRTKENAYGIYMFLNGKWKLVLVDDYLPCINKSEKMLCFGSSFRNELWVPLLEKAWAKVNGSYLRIGCGGFCNEVFDVLTEAYTEHIIIKNRGKDRDENEKIWKLLDDALQKKYMICVGTSGYPDLKEIGLINGHAYTLIKVYRVKTTRGWERVVKLRNPYGEIEYSGRWSDGDKIWEDNNLKSKFDFVKKEDGIFHMSYEIMLKYFFVIDIAKFEDNYHTKICKISKKENTKCQIIKLEIEEKQINCYINLYQKNKRILRKNGNYYKNPVLGFFILAKLNGDELTYISSKTSISENNYLMHFAINETLKRGTYYIFSDVNYRYNYNENYGYAITTYSDKKVKSLINITQYRTDTSSLLKKVIYDYCTNGKRLPKTSTNNLDIYRKNNDNIFPFTMFCLCNKTKSNIKIEFKNIQKEECYYGSCIYCDEKAKESDESVIKVIKPKPNDSYETFLVLPYDLRSKYQVKYNILSSA